MRMNINKTMQIISPPKRTPLTGITPNVSGTDFRESR
jgi:hypothetical protein